MQAHAQTRARLLARRVDGHWVGELSSSALSTATAAFALAQVGRSHHAPLIEPALQWLIDHQNADGSWPAAPNSHNEAKSGPLYSTSMAVLALTARWNYLPAFME